MKTPSTSAYGFHVCAHILSLSVCLLFFSFLPFFLSWSFVYLFFLLVQWWSTATLVDLVLAFGSRVSLMLGRPFPSGATSPVGTCFLICPGKLVIPAGKAPGRVIKSLETNMVTRWDSQGCRKHVTRHIRPVQTPFDPRPHTVWKTGTSSPFLSPACPSPRLDFNLQALRRHTGIRQR